MIVSSVLSCAVVALFALPSASWVSPNDAEKNLGPRLPVGVSGHSVRDDSVDEVQDDDGSIIVIDPEGNKSTVAAEDIDEIATNKESTMPAGLLNSLSLEEIASLFAFLNQQPRATVSQRPDR